MSTVSVVIPCYRSAATLGAVVRDVFEAARGWGDTLAEVVLVNDCSPDNTFELIEDLARQNPAVVGISLAKNFGQHAAILAGLGHCTGDFIVFLDDDGQTPPAEAGKLLAMLNRGHDAVCAKYPKKKHNFFRNFGSRVNDWMARVMLRKPKDLYISSYFAIKRFVAEEILKYKNPYPYVIGLVLRTTNDIVNVEIPHQLRQAGNSGYSLKKLFALWLNGFTAFSVMPLRAATVLGFATAAAGFIFTSYTVIRRLVVPDVPMGFSSTMAVLLFIGGMIMIMLGIIGEYIGRMYISLNESPQYVVRTVIKSEPEEK